jgi:hypothetical protein
VEGVVEGDTRALPVDAAQEPRTGRREVGDGEADAIAEGIMSGDTCVEMGVTYLPISTRPKRPQL